MEKEQTERVIKVLERIAFQLERIAELSKCVHKDPFYGDMVRTFEQTQYSSKEKES